MGTAREADDLGRAVPKPEKGQLARYGPTVLPQSRQPNEDPCIQSSWSISWLGATPRPSAKRNTVGRLGTR